MVRTPFLKHKTSLPADGGAAAMTTPPPPPSQPAGAASRDISPHARRLACRPAPAAAPEPWSRRDRQARRLRLPRRSRRQHLPLGNPKQICQGTSSSSLSSLSSSSSSLASSSSSSASSSSSSHKSGYHRRSRRHVLSTQLG